MDQIVFDVQDVNANLDAFDPLHVDVVARAGPLKVKGKLRAAAVRLLPHAPEVLNVGVVVADERTQGHVADARLCELRPLFFARLDLQEGPDGPVDVALEYFLAHALVDLLDQVRSLGAEHGQAPRAILILQHLQNFFLLLHLRVRLLCIRSFPVHGT